MNLTALKEASLRFDELKAAEKARDLKQDKQKAAKKSKAPSKIKDPNQPWSPPTTAKEE